MLLARNLLLTCLLEALVFFPVYRREWKSAIPFFLLLNAFTLPLATWAFVSGWNWWLTELAVTVTEALLMRLVWDQHTGRAVLTALAMNALSALLGACWF